ncbi:MAG: metal ABC transporter ATP-binding protein [Phycisphaerales bacterium]|jgi:manganese/zinc/iron transport system ATP- binding protein
MAVIATPQPHAGRSAALELDGFDAGYSAGEIRARGVVLRIGRGTMTALIGPNGAGKSTLLKGMLGLTPVHTPDAVRFFGEPLDAARQRVAYLPQRSEIDWDFPLSALDVVLMGLYAEIGLFRRIHRAARARALDALALVGMKELASRPIAALSGGQRQRVLVARALVQRAELLLLDEPFANVDAPTERAIADALRRRCDEGATVLAVHHDLGTVRARFDDAVLFNTTVLAHGPVQDTIDEISIARAYGFVAEAEGAG